MGDEVDLKIIQRHCQRQRPPVTVPAPLPVPVLTAVQVLVPLATTVPRSASVSASLPVQAPVSMLLHMLAPIVHFPASVQVHVQFRSSRLEYITWPKMARHPAHKYCKNIRWKSNFRVFGDNCSQPDQTGKRFSEPTSRPRSIEKQRR